MSNNPKAIDYGNWEPCYAWIRVKTVNKQWIWREHIYKRYVLSPGGGFWEYSTILDILSQ